MVPILLGSISLYASHVGTRMKAASCNARAVQDGVAGALPTYFGTRDALVRIFQDEGWRALYAGIAPALLGAGMLHLHLLIMQYSYMHNLSFHSIIRMRSLGSPSAIISCVSSM